jgi:hypothetical protein
VDLRDLPALDTDYVLVELVNFGMDYVLLELVDLENFETSIGRARPPETPI